MGGDREVATGEERELSREGRELSRYLTCVENAASKRIE